MKTSIVLTSLCALAFAGLTTCVSANVVVYGHAQVEIAKVDSNNNDQVVMEDNARGRIGVKVEEPLEDGLTAIAVAEFKADFADGDASKGNEDNVALTKREMMIGLKGFFGTVELGRVKSAYKYTGGVQYDPFVATLLEARGRYGMSGKVGPDQALGHFAFISDSIAYKTPEFMGASAWGTYSPDESSNDGALTYAVKYSPAKSWEVFIAGNDGGQADDEGLASKYKAQKAGGMIKILENHKLTAQYERNENNGAKADLIFAGYQGTFGKAVVVVQGGGDKVTGGGDGNGFTIGGIYNLSKNTRLHMGASHAFGDGLFGENKTYSLGIRIIF